MFWRDWELRTRLFIKVYIQRSTRVVVGVLSILVASCCPSRDTPEMDVRSLVNQLGSEAVDERELAFLGLVALGKGAIPEVERGVFDSDSEIACRCHELLELLAPSERSIRREVAHWLRHGIRDFDREYYGRCIRLCKAVLTIDPEYVVALKVLESAEKAQHVSPVYSRTGMFSEWERQACVDTGALPKQEEFHCPSVSRWPELRDQILLELGEMGDLSHDSSCIGLALETTKITLDARNCPIEHIIETLRDMSRLNIVFDASNGSPLEPVRRVDLHFENETLHTVLSRVLRILGMEYCITEENVVLLTDSEKASRHRR
jgi:hypothetical protein